jgi:hypothetical protein
MSAVNAVAGIVVSLNQGRIGALNPEAQKLFTTLIAVIPMKQLPAEPSHDGRACCPAIGLRKPAASDGGDQYMPGPGSHGMLVSLHGAVAKAATRGAG